MLKILLALLFLLTTVEAQLRTDAFGVMGGFVPLTAIDQPLTDGATSGGDVGYHTLEIWGGAPPMDVGGGMLLAGFSWERFAPRYERPEEIAQQRNLHQVGATVLWLRPLTARWMWMAIGMPSLNSDFHDGFGGDDLFISGASAVRWQVTSTVNVGLGAYLTWVFGDVATLPMVDVMYSGRRASFELAFPRSTFLYRLNERIELGATAFLDGGQYNFGDYNIPGGRVDHVELSSASLGPVINIGVGRGWLLNLQAGVVTAQLYELFDERDRLLPGGDASLEDTRFVRVGCTWRVPASGE